MFTLKRISTTPNSPIRVQVDAPADGEGGFGQGGTFNFYPAGQEDMGDVQHVMTQRAASTILDDPNLAGHFECTPPWPSQKAEPKPDDTSAPKAAGTKARAGKAATTK